MRVESTVSDPAVLSCWKDIARYLGKGVRTVQRWEQEFGLPVRRPSGVDHKSAVIAHARDLDAWIASRWSLREKLTNSPPSKLARTEWKDTIQRSRALREAHGALVHEMSDALRMLIQSCSQLSKYQAMMASQSLVPAYRRLVDEEPGG
ncbi:hypothetical protein [Acidobacterium sp. S8]|uniref:hypothetical protein n=1 Tax=Acidobacterium sp. S8 TaxID=1641854 RepID=UPI00131DB482|nr:hypothetical protein [Acidobacterium sp. S8]